MQARHWEPELVLIQRSYWWPQSPTACLQPPFSLRKFKNHSILMRTTADAKQLRNAQGRLRMDRIEVDIHLGAPAATIRFLDRALAQFEDFCVVTQSVRTAIPARVRVFDSSGRLLTE